MMIKLARTGIVFTSIRTKALIMACTMAVLRIPAAKAADAEHSALLAEVRRYADALVSAETTPGSLPLASVFAEGISIAAQLRTVLEALSETEYAEVQESMTGFVIERNEGIVVEPDYAWFLALAETIGTKTDRAFLALQLKLIPNGYWPAYVYRQTDYSGCTLFGEHLLSDLYAEATALLPDLPAMYRSRVEREINELSLQFTYSTCACSDKDTVIDELTYFLLTNADSQLVETVSERLEDVIDDSAGMRYECRSG